MDEDDQDVQIEDVGNGESFEKLILENIDDAVVNKIEKEMEKVMNKEKKKVIEWEFTSGDHEISSDVEEGGYKNKSDKEMQNGAFKSDIVKFSSDDPNMKSENKSDEELKVDKFTSDDMNISPNEAAKVKSNESKRDVGVIDSFGNAVDRETFEKHYEGIYDEYSSEVLVVHIKERDPKPIYSSSEFWNKDMGGEKMNINLKEDGLFNKKRMLVYRLKRRSLKI